MLLRAGIAFTFFGYAVHNFQCWAGTPGSLHSRTNTSTGAQHTLCSTPLSDSTEHFVTLQTEHDLLIPDSISISHPAVLGWKCLQKQNNILWLELLLVDIVQAEHSFLVFI